MNKFNYLLSIIILTVFLSACKKETPVNNNTSNPLGNSSPTLPSGAAGALYAINSNAFTQGSTITQGTAMAWFGSYTTTLQAGAVTCNSDSLSTQIPLVSYSYPWYESTLSGNNIDFSMNTVTWVVGGSGSVPAINFTDNAIFPVVNNFNAPATVSLSQPLTVTFSIANPYDQVICTIQGSKTAVNLNYASATSVTFTAAQLASTAVAGDNLLIQIMPVKWTTNTISGKVYYFVKENGFAQYATAQ